jgi:hypothetical protein
MPIMTDEGAYRYKLEGGGILERTVEEMAQDVEDEPKTPTLESRVGVLEEALEMILTGVVE